MIKLSIYVSRRFNRSHSGCCSTKMGFKIKLNQIKSFLGKSFPAAPTFFVWKVAAPLILMWEKLAVEACGQLGKQERKGRESAREFVRVFGWICLCKCVSMWVCLNVCVCAFEWVCWCIQMRVWECGCVDSVLYQGCMHRKPASRVTNCFVHWKKASLGTSIIINCNNFCCCYFIGLVPYGHLNWITGAEIQQLSFKRQFVFISNSLCMCGYTQTWIKHLCLLIGIWQSSHWCLQSCQACYGHCHKQLWCFFLKFTVTSS